MIIDRFLAAFKQQSVIPACLPIPDPLPLCRWQEHGLLELLPEMARRKEGLVLNKTSVAEDYGLW